MARRRGMIRYGSFAEVTHGIVTGREWLVYRFRRWAWGIVASFCYAVAVTSLLAFGQNKLSDVASVGVATFSTKAFLFVCQLTFIGFVATQVTALYLLIASTVDVNINELYAGQGIEDAKSFLRMHIAADGTLTIHPIGVDKICRKWTPDPDGASDASWLRPGDPLVPHRIEAPIQVR